MRNRTRLISETHLTSCSRHTTARFEGSGHKCYTTIEQTQVADRANALSKSADVEFRYRSELDGVMMRR